MANVKSKRIFLSFNLPPLISSEITRSVNALNFNKADIRLVRPETLHLTALFLGQVQEKYLPKLKNEIDSSLEKKGPLSFILRSPEALPSRSRPRVLYIGCAQTKGQPAKDLVSKIGKTLQPLSFLDFVAKPWHPHISIGRVKNLTPEIKSWLVISIPSLEFEISSLDLMESFLAPRGAEHKLLKSYEL